MTRTRGWLVHYVLLVGVYAALFIRAPAWLSNTLIALAFITGLALGCVEIRRRWRGQ